MSTPHEPYPEPGPSHTPIPEEAPDGPDPDVDEPTPPVPLQSIGPNHRPTITSIGDRKWAVRLPLGRDALTGRLLLHTKAIRGAKKTAQAYIDWYVSLMAAGCAPKDVIAQGELQDLAALERKAAAFRAKLLGRVAAGGIVEPGALSFDDEPGGEGRTASSIRS